MKPLHGLTIVVASPSDVEDERNIIKKVAEDLNNTIAKKRSLHLYVARWETDTYPGFHVDGPQAIIDDLLDIEDCDILIGIFWVRFGTPTKDARSGTEHEIRKAYEAWKRNNHPHIMLYFNKEPYSPKLEELDQWRQVLSFKREISQEALYAEYDGIPHFTDLVRDHLTQFILNMSDLPQKSSNTNISTAIKTPTSSPPSIEEQISLWLSSSEREGTVKTYKNNIDQFRRLVRRRGFDLDCEDDKIISPLVQHWANDGITPKQVSDYTYNTRLSTMSSFYQYALAHHWISKNPMEIVKRRKKKPRQPYNTDDMLNPDILVETIKTGLKSIKRSKLVGKRDYALLSMFLSTQRRPWELVALKCGDIHIEGNSVIVTWRNKGNPIPKALSPYVSPALIDYLEEAYGNDRPDDAPLMFNYSKQNRKKKIPIGRSVVSTLCKKYFKISNAEKIRQTLMILSERDEEGRKGVEKKLFGN